MAGALQTASRLPAAAGRALTRGADLAFLDGLHLAVLVGALLAAGSAILVYRYLPADVSMGAETASLASPVDVDDALDLAATAIR